MSQAPSSAIDTLDLTRAGHPCTCIVHVFFKIIAALCYFVVPIFLKNVMLFKLIFTVIFAAFDFWVVKNITGRLLVGLRWRKQMKEDGGEEWIFECRVNESNNNLVDSTFFWGGQFVFFAGWSVMFVINCVGLSYTAVIDFVCLSLNVVNLFNYYRCSNGNPSKIF